jgi:tyrosyl-tRNA synthetase
MSKSYGNHIGVAEPPEEQYGKTMRLPDQALGAWYDLLLGEPLPADLSPRDAKHALARKIVDRFHGPEAAEAAARHFAQVFVQGGVPDDIEEVVVAVSDGTIHLPALIAEHVGGSRSEARRLLAQGAVRLDGEVLGADDLDLAPDRLDGRVLQVGRRQFRRLRVGG